MFTLLPLPGAIILPLRVNGRWRKLSFGGRAGRCAGSDGDLWFWAAAERHRCRILGSCGWRQGLL